MIVTSAAAIVWFLFLRNSIPDAIAGHEIEHFDTFATESQARTLHTDQPVEYGTDPPVSGEHSPIPADCGVHDTMIPNVNMVHTLEHGAVGILYQPKVEKEQIEEIEEFVKSYDSHTFSAPYEPLETPFVIVAWAHRMPLETYDDAAVTEFIDVFRESADAPEEQECPLNADNSFTATPSPTPSPTETPVPAETKSDKKKDNDN